MVAASPNSQLFYLVVACEAMARKTGDERCHISICVRGNSSGVLSWKGDAGVVPESAWYMMERDSPWINQGDIVTIKLEECPNDRPDRPRAKNPNPLFRKPPARPHRLPAVGYHTTKRARWTVDPVGQVLAVDPVLHILNLGGRCMAMTLDLGMTV